MRSQRLHSALLLGLLLGLALPWGALAQDTSRVALPNIAPREVEILGTLEVSLPSLQRQPLVGFNPPPVVPRPPDGRRPFFERYKQASSDLPTSPLSRPQPPSALGAAYPPAQGQVESLVGRYFSRAVNTRIQAPISNQASFLFRADYRGSEGHEPFDAAPDLTAPFDALEGLVGVRTSGRQWAAGVTLSGFYESYDLFGLLPTNFPNDLSLITTFEREGRGGLGAVNLSTLGDTPVDARLDLSYGITRYETKEASSGTASTELFERRFEVDTDVRFPFSVGDAWFEGALSTASLADNLGTYSAFETGLGLNFEISPSLNLRVGGRLLGIFSDTEQPRFTATKDRLGYITPDVRLEFMPAPRIRFYVHNNPSVDANAVADVYRINPYLASQPELRPTMRPVDAEAGGSLFAGPVQFAARVGFQHMPQYLYFEDASERGTRGVTTLRYGEADVRHVGGSISVVLPGGLHSMVGVTYRDGRLTEEDTDIPYFAPLLGEATLSYSFAQSRGLFQVTGHYENARYVDRQPSRQVDAYIDLDVEASYKITPLIGVVFRVDNISGSDNAQWENYPESPVLFGAGLRVSW